MASYDQLSSLSGAVARGITSTDRDSIVRAARGIISETCDARWASGIQIMIDGTVYFSAIAFLVGDVIANLSMFVQAVGVGVSLSKVGIYSLTGTLLASSADQGTNWQSTGLKTIALQTPYVVPTTGVYYVACVAKAATTLPTITRGVTTAAMLSAAVGSGALPWAAQLTQTDLPAPATIVAGVTGFATWMAAS